MKNIKIKIASSFFVYLLMFNGQPIAQYNSLAACQAVANANQYCIWGG